MSTVSISDELLVRVEACKPLVEAVIGTALSAEEIVEFLLIRAVDTLLADLLANVDQPVLVRAFQLLAGEYPTEIYSFMIDMLSAGAAPIDREAFRQPLGFAAPLTNRDNGAPSA
jgi:hypothetical protein